MNEQLLRDLRQKLEAFKSQIAPDLRRLAALRQGPEGKQIAAELKKYAGLEPLLAALDGLGKRLDPATETMYDRIRRETADRQTPSEGPSLEERLRMGR